MRQLGTITGLVAGVVGLLGWLYALFGPTGHYVSTEVRTVGSTTGEPSGGGAVTTESGWTNMWSNEDFEAITIMFLLWMLLGVIGVLAGAILHGRYRLKAGRVILWASAIVLLLGAILGMFSIGLYLLPGAGLAMIAAVLVSSGRERSRTVSQM